MPELHEVESINYVNTGEIKNIIDRISAHFSGVIILGQEDVNYIYLCGLSKKRIMALPKISGISDFSLTGRLPLDSAPWSVLENIFKRLDEGIKNTSNLYTSIGYEEKSTKQSRKGYDCIGGGIEKEKYGFSYSPNASRAAIDVNYRKALMKEFFKKSGLNITIEECDNYFKLNAFEGDLQITIHGGVPNRNPIGFFYKFAQQTPQGLINVLRTAYEILSSGTVFDVSWRCSPSFADDGSFVGGDLWQFLDRLRHQEWPAKSYDLDLTLAVKELRDLEGLQSLCGPKDVIYTRLVSFDIDAADYGELTIETTQKGHKLQLEIKNIDNLDKVVNVIGVAFKDAR